MGVCQWTRRYSVVVSVSSEPAIGRRGGFVWLAVWLRRVRVPWLVCSTGRGQYEFDRVSAAYPSSIVVTLDLFV